MSIILAPQTKDFPCSILKPKCLRKKVKSTLPNYKPENYYKDLLQDYEPERFPTKPYDWGDSGTIYGSSNEDYSQTSNDCQLYGSLSGQQEELLDLRNDSSQMPGNQDDDFDAVTITVNKRVGFIVN